MRKGLHAWGPVIAWALIILVATTLPIPTDSLDTGDFPVDRVAHFVLYLGFGVTLGRALWLQRWRRLPSFLLAWTGGLVFAAIDEAHQAWIPSRVPSVGDWTADAAGITVGLLAYVVMGSIAFGRRRRGERGLERDEPTTRHRGEE